MKWITRREITRALVIGWIIKLLIGGVVLEIPQAQGFSLKTPLDWVQDRLPKYWYEKPLEGNSTQNKAIEEWLDKLETKENCPERGIVDSNGLKSYGKLCFQERTFVYFSLKYNVFPHTLSHELPNLMTGVEEQRKLARVMLENDPDAWTHWLNSTRKIGKP